MDIKQILEGLQEIINFDSMEDETGVNEIVENAEEKPAKMEKAEYKTMKIKEPEVDTVAKNLLKQYEEAAYLSDEDIAAQYDDFNCTEVQVQASKANEGWVNFTLELEFPDADHPDFNDYVIENGYWDTKEDRWGFDNWYPEKTLENLKDLVRKEAQKAGLIDDEEQPDANLEPLQRLNDKFILVRNKDTNKIQVHEFDDNAEDKVGNMITTKDFDTEDEAKDWFYSTHTKAESLLKEYEELEQYSMDFPLDELTFDIQQIILNIADVDEEDNYNFFVTTDTFKDYIDELKEEGQTDTIETLQDVLSYMDTFNKLYNGEVHQVKFLRYDEPNMDDPLIENHYEDDEWEYDEEDCPEDDEWEYEPDPALEEEIEKALQNYADELGINLGEIDDIKEAYQYVVDSLGINLDLHQVTSCIDKHIDEIERFKQDTMEESLKEEFKGEDFYHYSAYNKCKDIKKIKELIKTIRDDIKDAKDDKNLQQELKQDLNKAKALLKTVQDLKKNESKMDEISLETAEKVNIERQKQAVKKEAKAAQAVKDSEDANEKAIKSDKLLNKWKKSKGLKESKVVARFTENNNVHEIVKNKLGGYNIRYNVIEGKAQSVRGSVKSLPVALDVLKKRFPEAEEVKLNEISITPDEVERKRKDKLKDVKKNLQAKKDAYIQAKDDYEAPGPNDQVKLNKMIDKEKEYWDAKRQDDIATNKYIKTAIRNIKRNQK